MLVANDLHHIDLDPAPAPRAAGESVAVIINCGAGAGHDQLELAGRLRALFARHGLEAEVIVAEGGDDMGNAARAALERGTRTIVAGGGDGTVNAVASEVVDSSATFGVLPLGTLNHFARDLGIPFEIERAVEIIARGHTRRVDVGEVNGRIFLNNSSLGLYPNFVRDREKQQHQLGRGKWWAALLATVSALRRFPFMSVRLKIGPHEVPRRTPFVFIGNNEYAMEGLSLGARPALDRGTLSLYVPQNPGRLSLLRFALRALCGRLAQARDFDVVLVENMEIETRHKLLRVATDGEVRLMKAPLSYRVRPAALTVFAPS
ncbi:MAG TPA: diacylglycerol kinase family protein [Telluria sp.]|nr:diacylglycerol kinase family protein [Telluria sp.]